MGMRVICRILCSSFDNLAQLLYYTASIRLSQVIENMMPQIVDVNAVGGHYCTALQAGPLGDLRAVVSSLA